MKMTKSIGSSSHLFRQVFAPVIGLLLLLLIASVAGVGQSSLQLALANLEDTITPTETPVSVTNTPTGTSTPTVTPSCEVGWRVVDSPDVGSNYSVLNDITAESANDLWTVGNYTSNGKQQTLIERWSGMQWSVVSSPNMSTGDNYLQGVATVSTDDLWAVGYYTGTGRQQTLIERWDGNLWNVVPSPNAGSGNNVLNGVAVISPNDAWAVGYSEYGDSTRTLILHWDGTRWRAVASPNPGPGSYLHYLSGIAAVSARDVWAVGNSSFNTLIEHWDGNQWRVVPSPGSGTDAIFSLTSVAAIAANDIWAAGSVGGSHLYWPEPLLEHWDGRQWTIIATDFGRSHNISLIDIVALSATDIWAVGYSCCYPPNETISAALHWDGSRWTLILGPSSGANHDLFFGVAAVSANDVWAVGESYTLTNTQTLVERYTIRCPDPCPIHFGDVHPEDYFYTAVQMLYCRNVISGYSDSAFRPGSSTTRGQLTKIVALARGWTIDCPASGHFTDVTSDNVFYCFVETAYEHGVIGGYVDGTFRPGDEVSRGQLSKIIVLAMGWALECPSSGHFSDVLADNVFYCFVETGYSHGVVSGYSDGTFRPNSSATRGQICKIVYQAITQP